MKSFQHLTTVIALTLLASHQAFAAPTSARSDSQSNIYPMLFPIPSGNVAISSIGSVGNQVGVLTGNVPPNTVVISSDGNTPIELNGTSVAGTNLAKSIIKNVDDQIANAFSNALPRAMDVVGV